MCSSSCTSHFEFQVASRAGAPFAPPDRPRTYCRTEKKLFSDQASMSAIGFWCNLPHPEENPLPRRIVDRLLPVARRGTSVPQLVNANCQPLTGGACLSPQQHLDPQEGTRFGDAQVQGLQELWGFGLRDSRTVYVKSFGPIRRFKAQFLSSVTLCVQKEESLHASAFRSVHERQFLLCKPPDSCIVRSGSFFCRGLEPARKARKHGAHSGVHSSSERGKVCETNYSKTKDSLG